jgi:tRNA modification GTPase
MNADTIAAIATARGEAAIGVIRTSGPRAFDIARELTTLPDTIRSQHSYVRVLEHDGERLDEALVLTFCSPNTFTGEDIVEYHCHGGPVTLERVLRAVLERGARTAEAGEFSRRAMLNGKLDLLQVEAIADIIHAESEGAHRLAQSHLEGSLSRSVDELKSQLAETITLVEAAIDFSLEEHVYSISGDEIIEQLEPVRDQLSELLATYRSGRLQYEGVRVAIVGKPNAGKSTLLNRLLREDRAIVTEIAGTTRDYLEESCRIEGIHFRLIDTAGIRETSDTVERAGVERAEKLAKDADVIVVVADSTEDTPFSGLSSVEWNAPTGVLWNKADLGDDGASTGSLPEGLENANEIHVSLLEDRSIAAVEGLLVKLAEQAGYESSSSASALLTRERHYEVLTDALEALDRGLSAAEAQMPHEFIASDLRLSLDALGSLTGSITSDDILNRIFGDFCVGK